MRLTPYGAWTLFILTAMLIVSLVIYDNLWFFVGAIVGQLIFKHLINPDERYLKPRMPVLEDY